MREHATMLRAILIAALFLLMDPCALVHAQPAGEMEIGLESVAEGFGSPVTLAEAPDGSGRIFIVDRIGMIRILMPDGTLLPDPFLDVRDRMVTLMDNYDERGLLGLAFHPSFASNGRFFVYYSAPLRTGAPADYDNTSHVSEFTVSDDANVADAGSERILLEVDEPQSNHDAGTLAFGPDSYLYISLGDGGGANDTPMGHVDDWYDANGGGNGQDIENNLLGSILRIDVDGGEPYGIPADNPFVGTDGLDEIWAYGFRNPYRFSFDQGGDHRLFVGDAGQNRWEEVSIADRGSNLGWNVRVGTHCFDAANPDEDAASCPTEVTSGPRQGDPLTPPIIEYANGNQAGGLGLVVVGGVVYRGSDVPALDGRYIFGDWSASFQEPAGQLFAATEADEGLWPFDKLTIVNRPRGELGYYVLGIAQDLDGEAYVLVTSAAGPTGNTGEVYRIVPPEAATATEPRDLPTSFDLAQNYPNPFNPTTTIRFALEAPGRTRLAVYDVLGRRVATLVDGVLDAGNHRVSWDGTDASGHSLPSGAYLYRLAAGDQVRTRVMTLLK